MEPAQPIFTSHVIKALHDAEQLMKARGLQYGDTWRTCQFLVMQAVAKELGYQIKPEHFRALATAAFIDMKYARFSGGFKQDNLDDGINYMAFLVTEMKGLKEDAEDAQCAQRILNRMHGDFCDKDEGVKV